MSDKRAWLRQALRCAGHAASGARAHRAPHQHDRGAAQVGGVAHRMQLHRCVCCGSGRLGWRPAAYARLDQITADLGAAEALGAFPRGPKTAETRKTRVICEPVNLPHRLRPLLDQQAAERARRALSSGASGRGRDFLILLEGSGEVPPRVFNTLKTGCRGNEPFIRESSVCGICSQWFALDISTNRRSWSALNLPSI